MDKIMDFIVTLIGCFIATGLIVNLTMQPQHFPLYIAVSPAIAMAIINYRKINDL